MSGAPTKAKLHEAIALSRARLDNRIGDDA